MRYSFKIENEIFKNMFGFAGWNFLTTCASMLSTQGVSILLNMQFGPVINAARGVASQINGTVGAFHRNFTTALNPQITKTYAAEDFEYVKKLVCKGAKFSYLAFFFIALPCMIEVDFFLSVWLKEVPAFAGIFVQLTLLNSLVEVLLNSSETLNKAIGKIRNFQLIVSAAQFAILIASYIALKLTANPILVVAMANIMYLLIFAPRILVNKPYVGMTFGYYYKEVLQGIIMMSVISAALSLLPLMFMSDGWLRLITVGLISSITIIITSAIFVLTKGERNMVVSFVKSKLIH